MDVWGMYAQFILNFMDDAHLRQDSQGLHVLTLCITILGVL